MREGTAETISLMGNKGEGQSSLTFCHHYTIKNPNWASGLKGN